MENDDFEELKQCMAEMAILIEHVDLDRISFTADEWESIAKLNRMFATILSGELERLELIQSA